MYRTGVANKELPDHHFVAPATVGGAGIDFVFVVEAATDGVILDDLDTHSGDSVRRALGSCWR